jgi:hypothetical protein
MRFTTSFIAALAVLATCTASAQTQKQKPPKVLTLTGCVERDVSGADQFTLTDKTAGTKYRVTGKDFREYLGRPVQLDGGVVVKGIKISGGLQPNPNVAAQAGAIDPGRAAVQQATTPSAPGREIDVQEFRVKDIKTIGGSCQSNQ